MRNTRQKNGRSTRKGNCCVQNLTEEKVRQLAMSPLYILYLVAAEYVSCERITQRHIVRAVEYGLEWQGPFSEGIFDLLRSHLHEFYAEFVSRSGAVNQKAMRDELMAVKQILDQLSGPPAMIADFKKALKKFAGFVAMGGAFRQKIEHPAMQAQVAWLVELFAE